MVHATGTPRNQRSPNLQRIVPSSSSGILTKSYRNSTNVCAWICGKLVTLVAFIRCPDPGRTYPMTWILVLLCWVRITRTRKSRLAQGRRKRGVSSKRGATLPVSIETPLFSSQLTKRASKTSMRLPVAILPGNRSSMKRTLLISHRFR